MIMIILIIVATIAALLVALRAYMSAPGRVLKELAALPDLPDGDRAAAEACFRAAKDADDRTWLYDLSAPIVMLLVLPFVRRSADKLPSLFARWDNNVSLNGDGHGWLDDAGQWHHGRDGAPRPPGAHLYSYDDPLYGGGAAGIGGTAYYNSKTGQSTVTGAQANGGPGASLAYANDLSVSPGQVITFTTTSEGASSVAARVMWGDARSYPNDAGDV